MHRRQCAASDAPYLSRIFGLRHDLTAYDACYAEALGVPLLTDDAEFAGATGHRAEILCPG